MTREEFKEKYKLFDRDMIENLLFLAITNKDSKNCFNCKFNNRIEEKCTGARTHTKCTNPMSFADGHEIYDDDGCNKFEQKEVVQ